MARAMASTIIDKSDNFVESQTDTDINEITTDWFDSYK
jgi:hypothetical protein